MPINLLFYVLAFAGIWIGSGLAIASVERISKTLKLSTFAVAFIVLGIFTSISETSVGINALIQNDPEIYVGNLVGATIVIFMLIIPLLAITGNKIKITAEFQGFNLPASLVVVAIPVIFAMDGEIGKIDSWIAVVMYILLVLSVQAKKGFMDKVKHIGSRGLIGVEKELVRILFGVVVIFLASKIVVQQTEYFSQILNLSPFVISLLVIGIGTNIPELSFVIRSLFMKSTQIAFGDYVGSAAFNTFLVGILTLIYGKPVILTNSYMVSLLFLIIGLAAFYFFAKTKNSISRIEGVVLLCLYVIFVLVEVYIHKNLWK